TEYNRASIQIKFFGIKFATVPLRLIHFSRSVGGGVYADVIGSGGSPAINSNSRSVRTSVII
ncbi:hypothetical protein LRR18_18185, partial [Mangrovimonas sp. AS39]|uniref:hypothetical protein n=1 Tax=Mangrovimonas futianensis TaxID=2895523 RepID=UPI001E3DE15D